MSDDAVTAPPFMSVVIPTCNRSAEIARCLDALATQTHPNFEIIIIDDHSNDATPELLDQFQRDHPQVVMRWLQNKRHLGANPSRNRGVMEAKGELVAFADSDCVADPDWLLRLAQAFDSDADSDSDSDPAPVAAVVGMVNDPPPRNIFDLTFRGTHKVAGKTYANRLVGCNMCVRRDLLTAHMWDEDRGKEAVNADGSPDVTVSGRGDEEGLYLMLKAGGYEIRIARDAVVLHEHFYTARSFFKQAYRGGASAARLVYKYYLPPRLDLLGFVLAYLALPSALLGWPMLALPALFFAVALAAIIYNDLFRKRKTPLQTLITFPLLVIYYQVRLLGYVVQAARLRLGLNRLKRVRLG